MKTIYDYAFTTCHSLKSVDLTNVEKIGFGTFQLCISLAEVTVPGTIKNIPDHAFHGCSDVNILVFEDGVTSIDEDAALNMIWGNKYEKQWNEAYQLLCEYYKKNSSFDIPVNYIADNGVALGKWIRHQRDFFEKGKLSEDRIEKLRNIGFVLEKSDPWEEKFQLAKAYFEKYGNLDIPKGYISDCFGLGLWLDRQKKQYRNGKLSDEYIKLLEYIGIDWKENNQIEHLYETGFQHLEKFISEYGIETLTSNCVCDDGYNLGRWIANCKAKFRKGKLAEKYAIRFEKLGIRLDKER